MRNQKMINQPYFSVIVATIGEFPADSNVFHSFEKQIYKNFEVIIVHQGNSAVDYSWISFSGHIEVIKISEMGLSNARNVGLEYAKGTYISFMDDDAFIPEDYYEKAHAILKKNGFPAICGYVVDPVTNLPINKSIKKINKKFEIKLKHINYWMSSAIFIHIDIIRQLDGFCTDFGLGAEWGASEETELLLRMILLEIKVVFLPSLTVFHPNDHEKVTSSYKGALLRGFSYGKGRGACLKKFVSSRLKYFFYLMFLRDITFSCAGCIRSFIFMKPHHILKDIGSFTGKIYGFWKYKEKVIEKSDIT
jgi:glycosyltransferase involved in cell wall biosynthesis